MVLLLPALISAPASTKRTVMTPANGARTIWKACSSIRRCTLARLASTLAWAAITLDCSDSTLAWAASTSAWLESKAICRSSTSCWATRFRSRRARQRARLVRAYSVVARIVLERGARLLQPGAGLGQARLRRGGGGAGLRELLVEVRRVDLGQHLAALHPIADVHQPPLEVAVDPRVDGRFLDRLDAPGQGEVRGARARGRLDHRDHERSALGDLHRLGQLGVALDAGHDADDEQHREAEQAEEGQAQGAAAAPGGSRGARLRGRRLHDLVGSLETGPGGRDAGLRQLRMQLAGREGRPAAAAGCRSRGRRTAWPRWRARGRR